MESEERSGREGGGKRRRRKRRKRGRDLTLEKMERREGGG